MARVDQFLALAKKYTDFDQLTPPMICEFLDKILVHAPDRSMEDRTQEELVKMEKRRKRRAQYLEKTKRYAVRKKQDKHRRRG